MLSEIAAIFCDWALRPETPENSAPKMLISMSPIQWGLAVLLMGGVTAEG